MKTHRLTYIGGLTAVIVATAFLARTGELEWSSDALADQASQTLQINCGAAATQAFVPSVSYNVSMPAATADAFDVTASTVSASVTGNVNSADPLTIAKTLVAGALVAYHEAPISKVGGLQCDSNLGYAKLETSGGDGAGSKLDVALEDNSDTSWKSDNQIDSGSRTIFGVGAGNAAGLIYGSNLQDGTDADGVSNGEIAFGGTAGLAAHRMFLKIQYSGLDSNPFSESIQYTFTPSASQ